MKRAKLRMKLSARRVAQKAKDGKRRFFRRI
jgi:hypothetical protein